VESSGRKGPWFLPAWCLILGTVVLVLALFWQNVEVYFTFGDPIEPTAGDGTRWVWTASACVTVAVAAVVAAVVSGSRGMRWTSAITLVIALAAAVIFVVPHDRWSPPPKPNQLPTNYSPCYSGSNTCN
jgi:peptidoglycan/LPS O-acetylase OafA/YrhL